jgi:subtilisin family serine protease
VARQKPDFVAPDGVNNTFLGFVVNAAGSGIVQCRNNPTFPLFAGTSAATPHAAAAAALMLQSNPNVTAAQVLSALRTSASAMGATTPDFLSGYGFIKASAALAALPPPAPTISFSPTSITVGMSSTLTWSGINVTGCTASGSWSGAQAVSGTQTITPTAAGNLTYTLTCSNAVGTANRSAMLAVQPAPAGGGGGGGLDVAILLALAGLACARRVHTGRRAR